jgi:mannose/fructose/N-acetylgalactosamine-specific phosphotransferase system component IIB
MQRKIIFRVDDRLIHGQVIEGWIKYYKINHVFIVNDKIYGDILQEVIYSSVLPDYCDLKVLNKESFKAYFDESKVNNHILVLFENIQDLYDLRALITDKTYINIGCVASREHKIEITDTVFLDLEELRLLSELREKYNIYIKKLPWDTNIEIKNFYTFLKEMK